MTESITNIHGTEIHVDQVWADNDSRSEGRTLRVVAIESDSRRAVCTVLTDRGGETPARSRTVRISVDRLHPTTTGYRLVEQADVESEEQQ